MTVFFADLPRHAFLQYALVTGLLVSLACGVIGTYVVTRRISYIAGGISHSVLGGMGAAFFVRAVLGWEGVRPLHGAVAAALVSALVIGLVSLRGKEREDTVISAIWAIGMALGVIFIARTPGYAEELMGYLFGNILMISPREIELVAALDLAVLATVALFYHQFQAVCFDEEFARLRGLRADLYYLLLLALTALTVVLLVTAVGVVMVIALLTLPAAVAGLFARSMWRMMLLSVILCALITSFGLAASYGPDLPAGATIVVSAGAVYLAALVWRRFAAAFRTGTAGASAARPVDSARVTD
ncbi:MAG: metal ABC transporter permease [Deltaproteobacteria bacterium]|nr:metal ABC transporter permease [Deltaproteobacteria bacterium]